MMELLSPAGSRDAIRAAVQNGANGVYMGGSLFNARRFASNFSREELQDAIDYCHARGVKVYVTFNTLILDKELSAAAEYGAFLCQAGADAAIIQDIGLVRLLRKQVPELPLHASTQMGIHSREGAEAALRMGMTRMVLSREVPLKEIANIHSKCPIELEAFAHGALCMSFSGCCLLSSMAGERSGNRGTCAQPCRKHMTVNGPGQDYALSLGDLCMIEHLGDMEKAGVTCIKLEGRMKRAEYVAVVTRAYRDALDGADEKEIARHRRRMMDMFDRGGGCTGYFYGDDAKTGWVAKSDKSKALIADAARSYEKDMRKRPTAAFLSMFPGRPAELELRSGETSVSVIGEMVQKANKPQDPQRYEAQVRKMGDTPFYCEDCTAHVDKWAFLPIGAVNTMRREAAGKLENALKLRRPEPIVRANAVKVPAAQATVITVIVRDADQAAAAFKAGAHEVALEPYCYGAASFKKLQQYRKNGRLLISLPAVIISEEEREKIKKIISSGLVDGGIAANVGQLALIRELSVKIAGTQTNAMNSHTVAAYRDMGFDRVTLSLELTKPQLRDMAGAGTSVSVYGRAQLMQLRHCPVKEREGCRGCTGMAGHLEDEAGRKFPLSNIQQADGCLVRVLNCVPTDITDLYGELPRPEGIQLAFYDELPYQVGDKIKSAVWAGNGGRTYPADGATRGHWNRQVD